MQYGREGFRRETTNESASAMLAILEGIHTYIWRIQHRRSRSTQYHVLIILEFRILTSINEMRYLPARLETPGI
jgi:hypothetical protein